MASRAGGHFVYVRDGDLVVEWYDHGEAAAYESANLIVLGPEDQQRLAASLGALNMTQALADAVVARFGSYWDVKDFLEQNRIGFRGETDFMP